MTTPLIAGCRHPVRPFSSLDVIKRRITAIARDQGSPRTGWRGRTAVGLTAGAILPVSILAGPANQIAVPDFAGIVGRGDASVTPSGNPVVGSRGWLVGTHHKLVDRCAVFVEFKRCDGPERSPHAPSHRARDACGVV